jgi:hypothetical protein
MRFALAALLLAGCATAPADQPSRRAVSAAIVDWSACAPDETTSCLPTPRRLALTHLRCIPAPEAARPERVLCRFSGTRIMGLRHRLGFSGECVYLVRYAATGRWYIQHFPDADVCQF